MTKIKFFILPTIGMITGLVTGIFGGGGGMILVPLLTLMPELDQKTVFSSSVCIILPICIVSIFLSEGNHSLSWKELLPYLSGSFLGGIVAGTVGRKIPVRWLHRILGILVLWGGIRYLCQPAS